MSLAAAPLSLRPPASPLSLQQNSQRDVQTPQRISVTCATSPDHRNNANILQKLHRGISECGRFAAAAALAGALTLSNPEYASARLEGVNKPELLPQDFTRVIDTGGFLSAGQVRRLSEDLARLEDDTGFKLRVLSQSYPNTPGLAIRDYWGVDDDTIVFVADPTFKNILNFNVGATVDLRVPRSFWSRLAGKYGNIFYWRENGEDAAIEAAVIAIDACLREEPGPRQCSEIK